MDNFFVLIFFFESKLFKTENFDDVFSSTLHKVLLVVINRGFLSIFVDSFFLFDVPLIRLPGCLLLAVTGCGKLRWVAGWLDGWIAMAERLAFVAGRV